MNSVMRIGMRRALLVVVTLVGAALLASPAGAAIDNSITSPSDGAHSLSGIVPIDVTASASNGIQSLDLYVDNALSGISVTAPISGYDYEIDWDTSSLSAGSYTLSVEANSWDGTNQMSSPITVD